MANNRFRASHAKRRVIYNREGFISGQRSAAMDLDLSLVRRYRKNLADPVKGAQIELATKLGADKNRAKRVPITLAGPKFDD